MITIQPLRTKRLCVRFREITAGAAIRLAGIHPLKHENATTEFLRSIIDSAETPTPLHVTDPALWTVQERTLSVCHYLAAMAPLGDADFKIGDGRLTDYLLNNADYIDAVHLGDACDDTWQMVPMSGMAAEIIETLDGEIQDVPKGRVHWLIGSMASQLVRIGKDESPPVDAAGYMEWLKLRMQVFADFPESDFVELVRLRAEGAKRLDHLFCMDIGDSGMLAFPSREGAGAELPPARFPVGQCITGVARELGGGLPQFDS